MRKIWAGLFMSLDGVVESPDRWVFPYFNEEVGQAVGAGSQAADAMLLGRRTYEDWAGYWPDKTAEDDPYVKAAADDRHVAGAVGVEDDVQGPRDAGASTRAAAPTSFNSASPT